LTRSDARAGSPSRSQGAASPLAEDVRGVGGGAHPCTLSRRGEGGTRAAGVGGRGVTPCPVSHRRSAGAPVDVRAPHPPIAAQWAPPSPSGRGFYAVTLGVQRTKFHDFNALNFLDPIWSSPSRPPVSCSHLVAGKGRMASDRCGGGGRSSGDRRAGVDSRRWGARPPSASNGDKARVLPIGPRPRRPGLVGNDRNRVRLSLNRAAHRKLADNDGAERQASSKRYLFKHSGRRPALRDPFRSTQREIA
jgi:hypothetical protein